MKSHFHQVIVEWKFCGIQGQRGTTDAAEGETRWAALAKILLQPSHCVVWGILGWALEETRERTGGTRCFGTDDAVATSQKSLRLWSVFPPRTLSEYTVFIQHIIRFASSDFSVIHWSSESLNFCHPPDSPIKASRSSLSALGSCEQSLVICSPASRPSYRMGIIQDLRPPNRTMAGRTKSHIAPIVESGRF